MTCEDCDRARAGIWGGYASACEECTARGVARSLAAFNALDPGGNGDRESLRAVLAQALPKVETKRARAMVWAWWQADHEATEKATA